MRISLHRTICTENKKHLKDKGSAPHPGYFLQCAVSTRQAPSLPRGQLSAPYRSVSLLPCWHRVYSSCHLPPPHPWCRRGSYPATAPSTPLPTQPASHPQHLLHLPWTSHQLRMILLISTIHMLKSKGRKRGKTRGEEGGPPSPFFPLSICSFLLLSPAPRFLLSTGELWNNLRLVGFLHILISN